MNTDWLWDRNMSPADIKNILSNDQHDRFVELAALLFSRNNTPRKVFSEYIERERFVKNWQRIKRWMRKNNWNDQRIIYWQAVYERLIKDYKDKGIPVRTQKKPEIPDELYGQVGKKIKAMRKENRLTQKELAKKLGISQQIISHIEQGKANVSLLTLKKVANALGTNVIIDLTK